MGTTKIELQQQAYEEGFSQGEDGIQKATAEMQNSLKSQIVSWKIQKKCENILHQSSLPELSLTAAERIIGAALSQDEEIFLSIVKRGLKEARNERN